MKRVSIMSVLLLVASMMLSGCIVPYWDHGWHGGHHHDGGDGRGGGHRGGGGRR